MSYGMFLWASEVRLGLRLAGGDCSKGSFSIIRAGIAVGFVYMGIECTEFNVIACRCYFSTPSSPYYQITPPSREQRSPLSHSDLKAFYNIHINLTPSPLLHPHFFRAHP